MTPIALGVVVKAVGLRGEVKLRTTVDFWAEALHSRSLRLVQGGAQLPIRVERFRSPGPGAVIVKLAEIAGRTAAEAAVGAELILENAPDDVAPPPELRSFQVRGMCVVTSAGEDIGHVVEVMHLPAHPVLVVQGRTGRHLVPYVPAIVIETDAAAGTIRIDPPAGLLEL